MQVILVLIVFGLFFLLLPLLIAYSRSVRNRGPGEVKLGPLKYRAVYDPARSKAETRIVFWKHRILGFNSHPHRLAKGKKLKHIHIGPLTISLKGVAYEPVKKTHRRKKKKTRKNGKKETS